MKPLDSFATQEVAYFLGISKRAFFRNEKKVFFLVLTAIKPTTGDAIQRRT